ncbi:MAG: hypothetical protein MI924_18970 [Chloroflexales bacterium]|nr:hypothetical protein [Chloroflexales bacterium]
MITSMQFCGTTVIGCQATLLAPGENERCASARQQYGFRTLNGTPEIAARIEQRGVGCLT